MRSAWLVPFAFVTSAGVLFAYVGADVGPAVAGWLLPDARIFLSGAGSGSIETGRLNLYRAVVVLSVVACSGVGVVVGLGFHQAWRRLSRD